MDLDECMIGNPCVHGNCTKSCDTLSFEGRRFIESHGKYLNCIPKLHSKAWVAEVYIKLI